MTRFLFLIISIYAFSTISYSQEKFELTIERKHSSESCKMGYLIADGIVICYTLELPWKDNLKDVY